MSDTPAVKPAKAAAAKAAKAFEAPFEAFGFGAQGVEIPAAFRDFAATSLTGSKEAYAKMKAAAEEATEVFEDSIETARSGAVEFSHKSLDAAKQNSDATYAFFKELIGVKTFAEALELQMGFARKQTEAFAAQVKDLQDFSQKYVTEASRPVKASVEKAFKGATLN